MPHMSDDKIFSESRLEAHIAPMPKPLLESRLDSEKPCEVLDKRASLRGIYAISDERLTPYEILPHALESALKAGVKIFQLRDKSHSDTWLYPHAVGLMGLCERYNALFVLNDRAKLALEIAAPALHVGKDDGEIKSIARDFKGILGASSYGDISRAKVLESMGADYVAFGACFASPTKPNAPTITLEILAQARAELNIPICAIGGISTSNISLLKNAHMHAAISSLWGEPPANYNDKNLEAWLGHIAANAKALQQALD